MSALARTAHLLLALALVLTGAGLQPGSGDAACQDACCCAVRAAAECVPTGAPATSSCCGAEAPTRTRCNDREAPERACGCPCQREPGDTPRDRSQERSAPFVATPPECRGADFAPPPTVVSRTARHGLRPHRARAVHLELCVFRN